MAETFAIKRGDRLPAIRATLKDAAGVAVDLSSGVTAIVFNMHRKSSQSPKVVRGVATTVTAASGIVEYAWAAGDTDTAGDYLGEFEVVYTSGKSLTYPNGGDIAIRVSQDRG